MTIYDSTIDAQHNISATGDTGAISADIDAARTELADGTAPGTRVKEALTSASAKSGETVRNRPVATALAAVAVVAVAIAGVFGARKAAEARKPKSRWENLLATGKQTVGKATQTVGKATQTVGKATRR